VTLIPRGWFVIRDSLSGKPSECAGSLASDRDPGGCEFRLDLWQGESPERLPEEIGPALITDRGGAQSAEAGARTARRDQWAQRPQSWIDVDPETDAPAPEGVAWIISKHLTMDQADAVSTTVREAREKGAVAAKIVLPAETSLRRRLEVIREAERSDFPVVAFALGTHNHADRLWAREQGQAWGYVTDPSTATTLPGLPTSDEILHRYQWNDASADIDRYLILGADVRHSLTPDWHNALYAAKGIRARFYPWSTDQPQADLQAWEEFGMPAIRGLAITAPHKSWAREQGDGISDTCQQFQAWNTLAREKQQHFGTSTDGPGAWELLKEAIQKNGGPKGKRVAILGRGGAAQAVAKTLQSEGLEVTLYCRPGHLNPQASQPFQISDQPLEISEADLLINATGTDPLKSADWPWPLERFCGFAALEMDYSKGTTGFESRITDKLGIPVWSGSDFFASQARLQARIFHGIETTLEESLTLVRQIQSQRIRFQYPGGL
jgi:shikimate 5-dehydrogenase/3-dehydroquinate dehydratase